MLPGRGTLERRELQCVALRNGGDSGGWHFGTPGLRGVPSCGTLERVGGARRWTAAPVEPRPGPRGAAAGLRPALGPRVPPEPPHAASEPRRGSTAGSTAPVLRSTVDPAPLGSAGGPGGLHCGGVGVLLHSEHRQDLLLDFTSTCAHTPLPRVPPGDNGGDGPWNTLPSLGTPGSRLGLSPVLPRPPPGPPQAPSPMAEPESGPSDDVPGVFPSVDRVDGSTTMIQE